ncbi:histidine--tRNA ligase [Actinomadura logoneensis]|uniref:Histidine--tRNA ligase n=1 Tax=Actinomadura logoneensis TaxID=2293572 RepID=A0A372JBE2_9ACTN|nr:histidine--tRNA ligase [Actinomadura logoneensis]RFU37282.1 histidine--tRNA ligase [Actinomadura logoneensis]
MSSSFQAPKGISEYVPPRADLFYAVREAFAERARLAGYGYLEMAVFEDTNLFKRGVGESTDVVSKEMYTFTDRGGRSLTLRPEFTAGVLRAVLEHNLHKQGGLPVKVWTSGPAFRAERPQQGRYRQFYQLDLEAIGSEDPAVDAEVIAIATGWYRSLGLTRVRLLLNSLGCKRCRPAYRALLQDFLRGLDLDEATRERIEINPLRVLDDKRPAVREQLAGAPLMADHLCGDCKAYHDRVRELLGDLGIAFEDTPTLVRGLDYYTRTTFEFDHPMLGAQSGIGGGGRYDGLSEDIGGPELPGIGFGLGLDRTILALEAEAAERSAEQEPAFAPKPRCEVFAVPLGEAAERRVFDLVAGLREAGIAADMAFGGKRLKGAMKDADRSGARFALILGERDITEGVVQLKDLASGEQTPVPLTDTTSTLKERLSR